MDMEMSGLEPETDRILEVAVLVTDGELEVVAEGPNLVLHQVDEVLEAMDEWNTSHHGQSGLTQRVRESTIDEAQASAALMAFLAEHTTKKMAPLAGNSIHQDRRFVVATSMCRRSRSSRSAGTRSHTPAARRRKAATAPWTT
jgi:oligoribonuclease